MNKTELKEQIAGWKKKHGKVFQIDVEGKTCYLKTPDRKVLAMCAAVSNNDPLKYNETLLNNCWLGGDEEIKTDDSLFLGVSAKLGGLIDIKEAELKEV